MISRVTSFILHGVRAETCRIEVDLSPHGLPTIGIVGLPDAAVRESAERVRTAIRNAGFPWPRSRLTVNLAPADVRKEGPVYDLPIAAGVLAASGSIRDASAGGRRIEDWPMAGELALDGTVRPVRGVLALAELAARANAAGVIVASASASEARLVSDLPVVAVDDLRGLASFLGGLDPVPSSVEESGSSTSDPHDRHRPTTLDLSSIRGQSVAKRAVEIAAVGGHNLLLVGPPGCGKTMIARGLVDLLPPLRRDEILEVQAVRSAAGLPFDAATLSRPGFRTPHHTSSAAALVGGGSNPRPGEVSLAHHGILMLDELPEFSAAAIDALREPLEDGVVTVARAAGTVRFPASVVVVGTMNGSRSGSAGPSSGEGVDRRVLERIGAAVLDRFDLHVIMRATPVAAFLDPPDGPSTEAVRRRVDSARSFGAARSGPLNARLSGERLDTACALDRSSLHRLAKMVEELGLSGRAFDRIRRVARSIADLDGSTRVGSTHLEEAVGYRVLDRC
ncbi:MAG: YifB family Mg chelatase-like AAA ATPase [Phycisphaeraceae bacterium]|nr:YifB family Mg chelatase-like AAA ATPase [Phycisphaeraceae bacterium]